MSKAIPYVLQDNFVSVIIDARPFQLLKSHPTFKAMVLALKGKKWDKVPNLVNLARNISSKAHGNVKIENGKVYYKGSEVDSSLTKRMVEMVEHNQKVTPMLRFLDNLMLNPVQSTIQELYDFLKKYNLPITDRGTFCAYKRVKDDYTDCHTGTVDNHIGQIPVMPFFEVDQDRTNLCSRGYHFCSRAYLSGFHGGHLMVIEINPAEVVEIPPSNCVEGKGRSWRYEVIAEIANEDYTKEDAAYLQRPVVPVEKDRRTLLAKLLVLPTVKRLIARTERARKLRSRKSSNVHLPVEKAGLTREALGKASLGRLQHWYERFAPIDPSVKVPAESPLFKNPTRPARLTSGVSIVDLAARMKMKASDVYRIEKAESPNQESIDKYLAALIAIKNVGGVTYKTAAATA